MVPHGCPGSGATSEPKGPAASRSWAKPYGASTGAKIATRTKMPVSTSPMISMPRCMPDALPELMDDRQPPPAEAAPGGQLPRGAHQYLTRGSISAAMMSTTKFVTATITAIRTTMPWTAT